MFIFMLMNSDYLRFILAIRNYLEFTFMLANKLLTFTLMLVNNLLTIYIYVKKFILGIKALQLEDYENKWMHIIKQAEKL